MFVEWMAKLLGRPPEEDGGSGGKVLLEPLPLGVRSERRQRKKSLPGRAGSRKYDQRDVFDPRRIAEYDLHARVPLSPHECAQLTVLSAQTRAQCKLRADTGLALPHLAQRLIRRIAESDLDLNDLVQLIQQDPIVSAHVLRAANGTRYQSLGEARGIRAAVLRLGVEASRQIAVVTIVHAFTESETMTLHRIFAPYWKDIRRHSLATAAGCGYLAMSLKRCDVERAFLAGLLHDVGKFFALRALSELVLRGDLQEPSAPLIETMLEDLHVELGIQLCERWHLPAFVHHVCADHHPEEDGGAPPEVMMVRVVSALDEIRTNPWHRGTLVTQALRASSALNMSATRVRALFTRLREASSRAEEL